MEDSESKPNFFERIISRFSGDMPESVAQIVRSLHLARDGQLIDNETVSLLEKVLAFADLEVSDVMVSRAHMDVIKIDTPIQECVDYIIETAHSRFPVIGKDKDEILGILHAKDLLRYFNRPQELQLQPLLREATFVPESKSLPSLLKDFRDKHIHLAMVVDEYGGVSGLITFEDILEAIIGEIEDEFDEDEEADIVAVEENLFRVNAVAEIEEFNRFFGSQFSDEEVDSIGGLIISEFGRLPQKGEEISLEGLHFTVARSDHRRLYVLTVRREQAPV